LIIEIVLGQSTHNLSFVNSHHIAYIIDYSFTYDTVKFSFAKPLHSNWCYRAALIFHDLKKDLACI